MVHRPQHDLDETFWQKRILSQEDHRNRPIPPLWNGSYLWFRSPTLLTFGTIAAQPGSCARRSV
jgi:hypothetical protein